MGNTSLESIPIGQNLRQEGDLVSSKGEHPTETELLKSQIKGVVVGIPEIDITIVSFNYFEYLPKLIKSIVLYTKTPHTLTIVDNNSPDKRVIEYLKELKEKKSECDIIFNDKNEGYAKAVNRGAKLGKASFLVILNADLLFIEDSITKMIEIMEKNTDIGVLGPKLINANGDIVGAGTYGSFQKRYFKYFNEKDKDSPESLFNQQADCINVCGAFYMTRRKLFEELGGFDEDFHLYHEEEFYSFKVQILKKMRVVYTPVTKAIHYWEAKKYASSEYQDNIKKSREIFLRKCKELGLEGVQP